MTAALKPHITPEEYLARERQALTKSEYLRGEVFAMAGASYAHNRICDNLVSACRQAMGNGPCYTLSRDMRVKVTATGLYAYPDLLILCDPPELEDLHGDTLLNPRVIIEVLSDSTEGYDRGAKFRHYQQIPTLREYLLVSQNEPVAERFTRQADGNWLLTTVTGIEGILPLSTVPATIALRDVYAGVTFPEAPSPGAVS